MEEAISLIKQLTISGWQTRLLSLSGVRQGQRTRQLGSGLTDNIIPEKQLPVAPFVTIPTQEIFADRNNPAITGNSYYCNSISDKHILLNITKLLLYCRICNSSFIKSLDSFILRYMLSFSISSKSLYFSQISTLIY